MKYLNLETLTDFKCIGSECPFTCCAGGWKIPIDRDSYNSYINVAGDFGDRLAGSIQEDKGTKFFVLTEDGRCPFLNEKDLCDIYINLGEDHLCYTCTTYPRYIFTEGDIQFAGVMISCPEVAKTLLRHSEPIRIDFGEDRKKCKNESGIDWKTFNYSIRVFTTAIGIVQDRDFSISERLAALTIFIYQFQACIDGQREPSGFIDLFSDHNNFEKILPQTGVINRDLVSKVVFCAEFIKYLKRLNKFETALPELNELVTYFERGGEIEIDLKKLKASYMELDDETSQIWREQLVAYSMHRYFMQGFSKKNFYKKFLIGVLLIYGINVSVVSLYYTRWDCLPEFDVLALIVAHTSRIVEHDDSFTDAIIEHFVERGVTDTANLFKLFS